MSKSCSPKEIPNHRSWQSKKSTVMALEHDVDQSENGSSKALQNNGKILLRKVCMLRTKISFPKQLVHVRGKITFLTNFNRRRGYEKQFASGNILS